jgi:hypothetical protein
MSVMTARPTTDSGKKKSPTTGARKAMQMGTPPRRGTDWRWTLRPPGCETAPTRMAKRRTNGMSAALSSAAATKATM